MFIYFLPKSVCLSFFFVYKMFGGGKTIQDVDVRILLDLDIQSLSNQCFTSKFAHQFCSQQQFWINKYNHDQLPLFTPYPNTIKQWIDDYKLTLEASNILLVNEIELTKEDPIDDLIGVISVYKLETVYTKVSKLPIPDQLKSDIQSDIGNELHEDNSHSLHFKYINHDEYELQFSAYIETEDYDEEVLYPIHIDRASAIQILKVILNTKLEITDTELLPYQQNKVYEYIDEYTPKYILDIINERKKIWQYITENQNKSVVLI
ncbi:MAG TPA: hypothetical protein VLG50_07995 [Candidatus Saccharimonadales bacterium]|nr:hypothetical protein [Candidatus Saccharimonadales bacterium]